MIEAILGLMTGILGSLLYFVLRNTGKIGEIKGKLENLESHIRIIYDELRELKEYIFGK